MITRQNGRKTFYQWDLDQKLVLTEIEGELDVHFWQEGQSEALVVTPTTEGGLVLVAVPNILLQNALPLKIYIWRKDIGAFTTHQQIFQVLEREKPADYVYTETEVKRWEDVDARSQEALETAKSLEARADAGEFKGEKGEPGKPGAPGKDYILTEADKTEIADIVLSNFGDVSEAGQWELLQSKEISEEDGEINGLTITFPEGYTEYVVTLERTAPTVSKHTIVYPQVIREGDPFVRNFEFWSYTYEGENPSQFDLRFSSIDLPGTKALNMEGFGVATSAVKGKPQNLKTSGWCFGYEKWVGVRFDTLLNVGSKYIVWGHK